MRHPIRTVATWAVRFSIVAALAGCSAVASAPSAGEPRVIDITIDGYHFVPDHFTVRVGESVRFRITNPDTIGHELYLGTIEEQADRRIAGVPTPSEESAVTHFGYGIYLPARSGGEFSYMFSSENDLLIGCHLPGHWEEGMVATIDVEP